MSDTKPQADGFIIHDSIEYEIFIRKEDYQLKMKNDAVHQLVAFTITRDALKASLNGYEGVKLNKEQKAMKLKIIKSQYALDELIGDLGYEVWKRVKASAEKDEYEQMQKDSGIKVVKSLPEQK